MSTKFKPTGVVCSTRLDLGGANGHMVEPMGVQMCYVKIGVYVSLRTANKIWRE